MLDIGEIQRTLERKQMDKKQCQQMLNEITRKKEVIPLLASYFPRFQNYDEEFAKFKKLENEIAQRFPEMNEANITEQLTSFYLERNELLNAAKVCSYEKKNQIYILRGYTAQLERIFSVNATTP